MATNIAIPALTATGIKNSVTSLMGSARYIQAFVPIAIYNILHKRINYQDSYFVKHTLEKIPYVVFSKRIPKSHPLFSVAHWIKDAMTGVNDRYINKLYLVVRNKITKEVIEYYCFSINYTDDNGVARFDVLPKEVSEKTAKLFKTINYLADQEKLNSDDVSYAIQVELNDKAPKDYVTKSFRRSDNGYLTSNYTSDQVPFGTINTGFHKLKMSAKGNVFNLDEERLTEEANDVQCEVDEDEVDNPASHLKIQKVEGGIRAGPNNNDSLPAIETADKKQRNAEDKNVGVEIIEDEDFEINPFSVMKRKGAAEKANKRSKKTKRAGEDDCSKDVNNSVQNMDIESLASADYFEEIAFQENLVTRDDDIVCLCTLPYNIPNIEKIACTMCKKYQHVACGGFISSAIIPHPHTCYNCYKEKGAKSNDIRLYCAKSEAMRFKMSILRLVTVFCSKIEQSPEMFLNLLSADLNKAAFTDLIRYRMLVKENGTYVANQTKVSSMLKSVMFYTEADSMELANSGVID